MVNVRSRPERRFLRARARGAARAVLGGQEYVVEFSGVLQQHHWGMRALEFVRTAAVAFADVTIVGFVILAVWYPHRVDWSTLLYKYLILCVTLLIWQAVYIADWCNAVTATLVHPSTISDDTSD